MLPNLHAPDRATPADLAACREMIRGGSRSFYAASHFLPERVRGGAYALYAFCRLSDDSVDEMRGGADAIAGLAARLDRIYAGAPASAVDRAMTDTVERFAIPRAVFDALLEGLAWDAEGRQCETLDDLFAYAARVAGSVGAMMAALMDARTPDLVARACDLGVAMQLTNVARDIGEDARAGRLYAPRQWMREERLDPDVWLVSPRFDARIAAVTARLLRHADELYLRADAGIDALPECFRPAIYAARHLYAEIGQEVARGAHDSVSRRAIVPFARKMALTLNALVQSKRRAIVDCSAPPLPQTQFLVDAITGTSAPSAIRGSVRRVHWVIDLFTALEQRPGRMA